MKLIIDDLIKKRMLLLKKTNFSMRYKCLEKD